MICLRISLVVALLALACTRIGDAADAQFGNDGVCGSGSFACTSGGVDCVLLTQRCDNVNDCSDGSDELGCAVCEAPNFRCPDGLCLRETQLCDGVNHCTNGEDESLAYCASHQCAPGYFSCAEGYRCIESHLVCDGRANCPDRSDENQPVCVNTMNTCNLPNAFNCSDYCIEPEEVCNGINDCDDARDEANCTTDSSAFSCSSALQFACVNTKQCIDITDRCNDVEDCEDGEDEQGCVLSRVTSPPSAVIEPCSIAEEFRCGPKGACLPADLRCDGSRDCNDGSDEVGCPPRNASVARCASGEFSCRAMGSEPVRCFPNARRCDKFSDCPLGDDEADCPSVVAPPVDGIDSSPVFICDKITQFLCASSSSCIEKAARCNGLRDCVNGEDEVGCELDAERDPCSPTNIGLCEQLCVPVALAVSSNATRQRYTCGCLNGFRLAGPFSCADIDECATGVSQCSQRCENSPGSFRCSCVEHYALDLLDRSTCRASGDKLLFVLFRDELRELRLARLPGQALENVYDSKVGGPQAIAVGATKNATLSQMVKNVEVIGTSVTSDRQLMQNISFAVAFDTDTAMRLVFWASRSSRRSRMSGLYMTNWEVQALFSRQAESIRRQIIDMVQERLSPGGIGADASNEPVSEKMKRLRQLEATQKEIVEFMKQLQANASTSIPQNLTVTMYEDPRAKIEAVAFDWLNRLVYWTDANYKHIAVISQLTGRWRPVIEEQLNSPRALVLDPEFGTMYFSDHAEGNAFIHSAGMDGSNRVLILDSRHVAWPNGLTIDYASRRLYFIDAKLAYIGYCLLDVQPAFVGSTCNRLYTDAEALHPSTSLLYSISMFEDHLFWTDSRRGIVRTCNRFACNSTLRTLVVNRPDLHAVSVVHALRQPGAGSSIGYCLAAGQQCPFLCLPTRLERGSNAPNARCVCDIGERFVPSGQLLTGTCVVQSDSVPRQPKLQPTPETIAVAQDVPPNLAPVSEDESSDVGRVAVIVICTLLGVVVLAVLVAVLVYRNYSKRNVKSMNFDNPVYRRSATTQHFFATPGGGTVVNVTANSYALASSPENEQDAKRADSEAQSRNVSLNHTTDSARYVASPARRPAAGASDPSETRRLTAAQGAAPDV